MGYIDYIVLRSRLMFIGKVQEMRTKPPMLFLYIPKAIASAAGLKKGDVVFFEVDGRKRIIIKKLK